MFHLVPEIRAEGQFECRGHVPGDQGKCGENPADERMREKFPQRLCGGPAKKRAEDGTHERLRKAVKQRKSGSAEKDERRNDQHQQDVLDHVDGEGCSRQKQKAANQWRPREGTCWLEKLRDAESRAGLGK